MNRMERWAKALGHRENRSTWGVVAGLSFTSVPVWVSFAYGIPTLPPSWMWLHATLTAAAGWACYQLVVALLATLLALVRLPLPRLCIASVLCFGAGTFAGWSYYAITVPGALVVTAIYLAIGIAAGTAVSALTARPLRLSAAMYGILAAVAAAGSVLWLYGPGAETYPPGSSMASGASITVEPLAAEHPARPGPYSVEAFTYGSGEDPFRAEFAGEAALRSPTVDASGFVDEWHRLRTLYWGFGPDELPLNGRVWMPEGEGPFPLALIVHGNHNMEQFSDGGYAYLGEQLASRGILTVSIDENFINYSNWSDSVEPDMTLRAWMMLQHLQWIVRMGEAPGSAFYGKVDADNVALMGHSRGGQAAALAASFRAFFDGAADIPLPDDTHYRIRSVVAIAPIDRAVDKEYVRLRNVNYLVLQGAMDGDVNVFYGYRQYSRIRWSDGGDYLKTALYIQGANHGQFNTSWGDSDIASPLRLLLNKKDMLSGEAQRDIAKLYVSAFLETTLKGEDAYIPMLQDYRRVSAWLPDAAYLLQYEDSSFQPIVRYEEDDDKQTTAVYGGEIRVKGMKRWEEKDIEDREGDSLFNDAVYLSWDGQEPAVYELDLAELGKRTVVAGADSWLGFDLANANLDPRKREKRPPAIELEIELAGGERRRIKLEEAMPVPRAIHTRFTKSVFFEEALRKGNLGQSAEATMQTFLVPLSLFGLPDTAETEHLVRLRFLFPEGASGRIVLDNIGWYPQGVLTELTRR